MCRNQAITRHYGEKDFVIDIDVRAVESAMRMKGIPKKRQWVVLNRVRRLFMHMQKEDEGRRG